MKNKIQIILVLFVSVFSMNFVCDWQERQDKIAVIEQQEHYRKGQAVPFYE